ncbi:tetratricopeptide repeat protein [Actinoplanes sp. NPDC051346]|uniref:tetratricopeptide repeat protein n=1 Tax=Actinoplanes sp. NPDC051346 TaxID=3155048 RepID=UPI00341C4577
MPNDDADRTAAPGARALYDAGTTRLRHGDPAGALADLDRSLAAEDAFAPAWVNRGIALADLGRADEARAAFDRGLALDAELVPGWRCRAILRARQGDQDGAIEDYARVTVLRPGDHGAHRELGDALAALPPDGHVDERPDGRLRQAVAAYDRALALDDGDAGAWAGKARVLAVLAHAAQSVERASRVAGIAPWVSFPAAHQELSRHLDAAVARFPETAWFRHERALAYRQVGDAAGEITQLRAACELNPDSGAGHFELARAYAADGQRQQARRSFDAAVERDPALRGRAADVLGEDAAARDGMDGMER